MRRSTAKRMFIAAMTPVLRVLLGYSVINRTGLPSCGPAVVIANHNSHLDTLALLSAFPRQARRYVRAAAAADHFGAGMLGFVARTLLDVVLVDRHAATPDIALAGVDAALRDGSILIFFPEGSRGQPERMTRFRNGIGRLAARFPDIPIVPVHLRGFGKALPRGSFLPLPASCEAIVGSPLNLAGLTAAEASAAAEAAVVALGQQSGLALWDDEEADHQGTVRPR